MSLQILQGLPQIHDGVPERDPQMADAGFRTDCPLTFLSPLSQHLAYREVGLALYQITCVRHQWETVIAGIWAAEAVECPGCLHG